MINCSCKKFYGTGPKKLTFKKVNELRGLENKPFGGFNSSWSQYFLKPFFFFVKDGKAEQAISN